MFTNEDILEFEEIGRNTKLMIKDGRQIYVYGGDKKVYKNKIIFSVLFINIAIQALYDKELKTTQENIQEKMIEMLKTLNYVYIKSTKKGFSNNFNFDELLNLKYYKGRSFYYTFIQEIKRLDALLDVCEEKFKKENKNNKKLIQAFNKKRTKISALFKEKSENEHKKQTKNTNSSQQNLQNQEILKNIQDRKDVKNSEQKNLFKSDDCEKLYNITKNYNSFKIANKKCFVGDNENQGDIVFESDPHYYEILFAKNVLLIIEQTDTLDVYQSSKKNAYKSFSATLNYVTQSIIDECRINKKLNLPYLESFVDSFKKYENRQAYENYVKTKLKIDDFKVPEIKEYKKRKPRNKKSVNKKQEQFASII